MGQTVVPPSRLVRLTGWAANLSDGSLPAEIYIRLEAESGGPLFAQATRLGMHMPRSDVAEFYSDERLEPSGWSLLADLASLSPQQYTLTVLQRVGDRLLECPTQITLHLAPE